MKKAIILYALSSIVSLRAAGVFEQLNKSNDDVEMSNNVDKIFKNCSDAIKKLDPTKLEMLLQNGGDYSQDVVTYAGCPDDERQPLNAHPKTLQEMLKEKSDDSILLTEMRYSAVAGIFGFAGAFNLFTAIIKQGYCSGLEEFLGGVNNITDGYNTYIEYENAQLEKLSCNVSSIGYAPPGCADEIEKNYPNCGVFGSCELNQSPPTIKKIGMLGSFEPEVDSFAFTAEISASLGSMYAGWKIVNSLLNGELKKNRQMKIKLMKTILKKYKKQ